MPREGSVVLGWKGRGIVDWDIERFLPRARQCADVYAEVEDSDCVVALDPVRWRREPHRFVLAAPDERTRRRTAIEWLGLPLRPVECLTRHQTLALLDWTPSGGEERPKNLGSSAKNISRGNNSLNAR
jgi:hypothetical protein